MAMQTLVVVPTYNEIGTINQVIEVVTAGGFELLVVDDGSPDGTADVVQHAAIRRPGVHLLRRSTKDGLGSAYRAGFAWALRSGRYDVVGQMDADLSHDPHDLTRLLAAIRHEGADVAIGSRYVPDGGIVGWPARRQLLSRGGNRYMRVVTGIPVNDMTAGFRLWRADALAELGLCDTQSEGYSFQLETTVRAHVAGVRIVEVPITFTERQVGASKMNGSVVREALWRVMVWGWQLRWSPEQLRAPAPAPVPADAAPTPTPAAPRAQDLDPIRLVHRADEPTDEPVPARLRRRA
jgi:dolichol-phosphate mannosyltransferase